MIDRGGNTSKLKAGVIFGSRASNLALTLLMLVAGGSMNAPDECPGRKGEEEIPVPKE